MSMAVDSLYKQQNQKSGNHRKKDHVLTTTTRKWENSLFSCVFFEAAISCILEKFIQKLFDSRSRGRTEQMNTFQAVEIFMFLYRSLSTTKQRHGYAKGTKNCSGTNDKRKTKANLWHNHRQTSDALRRWRRRRRQWFPSKFQLKK